MVEVSVRTSLHIPLVMVFTFIILPMQCWLSAIEVFYGSLSRYPSLHRPFKVPLSTFGCLIMLLPALVLLLTMLILPIVVRDWQVVLFTAGTLAIGSFLYPLLQHAREKQWFQFEDCSPEDFSEHLASTYAPVVDEGDNDEGVAQHGLP